MLKKNIFFPLLTLLLLLPLLGAQACPMHEGKPDALEPAAGDFFTGDQTGAENETQDAKMTPKMTPESGDAQKSDSGNASGNRPSPSANAMYGDLNQ